jgi:filamentous hemagglutinin family protein
MRQLISSQALLSTTSMTSVVRRMALAVTGVMVASSSAFAGPLPTVGNNALPTNGHVLSGNGTANISQTTGNMTVDTSNRVIIDWDTFNIGKNADVTFNQAGTGGLAVNRISDGNPSQILGSLHANGNIILLNHNGIIFGANSHVDVAGLLVSTGDIKNDNKFMNAAANAKLHLKNINSGNGTITNNGHITVAQGGLAAFVAPQFVNNGVIEAKLGKIAIAGGADKATVDMYGDELVELALDANASKAVITNNGTLRANGGKIAITVEAAQNIVDSSINMNGVVEANSFKQKNGVISLDATNADINVAGKITAKGGNGKIAVHSNKDINIAQTAELNASAGKVGNGGDITVIADGKTDFEGAVLARGGYQSGNGGTAEISGYEALGFSGYADLGANNGTIGTLTLDPNWAIIHSGVADGFGGYLISAQALANAMETSNVVVQADQFIDVGTKDSYGSDILNLLAGALLGNGNIDLSTFNYTALNTHGSPLPWKWTLDNHTGPTTGTLTLNSSTVNFNKDLKLGTGDLVVDANTVNLNAHISDSTGPLDQSSITSTASVVNVISNKAFIQQGLYLLANTGGAVNVGAGTYNEAITVKKAATITGSAANDTIIDGTGTAGVTGITVSADNVTLNHLVVKNWYNGLGVNSVIKKLSMDNLTSSNNYYAGFDVSNTGSIDGLTIANSHFDNNGLNPNPGDNDFGYGWYFTKNDSDPLNTTDVNHVTVTDTTFNGDAQKGIYAEKLDNATFTNVHVDNTGINPTSIFGNVGIDINLKNGVYSNIVFDNLTMDGSGMDSSAKSGIALTVKARNDGSYSAIPATLTGLVIENSNIKAAGTQGIAIGNNVQNAQIMNNQQIDAAEALSLYGGATADIHDNTITNASIFGIGVADGKATIWKNNITSNGGVGIILSNADQSVVGDTASDTNGNVIDGAATGIQLVNDTSDVTIAHNTIKNIAYGYNNSAINISGGTNVTASDNTITNSQGRGIIADTTSMLKLLTNKITNTAFDAINLFKVTGGTVQENTIDGTTYGDGISMTLTSDINVLKNGIQNVAYSGIDLWYGNTGTVIEGNTIQALQNGIELSNASGQDNENITIGSAAPGLGNTITAGTVGISVDTGKVINIIGNTISHAGVTGIDVSGLTGVINQIYFNKIDSSVDGIHATNAQNLLVTDNRIGLNVNMTGNGIVIDSSEGAYIVQNRIMNVALNGIHVENTSNAILQNNTVTTAGQNGILVEGGADNKIGDSSSTAFANTITGAGADGIEISNSQTAHVDNNIINGAGFGIVATSGSISATIHGNNISNIGWDGIQLNNGSNGAMVTNNVISHVTGASGVAVIGATGATIDTNMISDVARLGVYAESADGIKVTNNDIDNAGTAFSSYSAFGSGIAIEATNGITITGNHIDTVSGDGINLGSPINTGGNNVSNAVVDGNFIGQTASIGGDGIHATNGVTSASSNQISRTTGDGIDISNSNDVNIHSNTISNPGANGILLQNSIGATIGGKTYALGNTINGTLGGYGSAGIQVNGGSANTVDHNIINNSGADGILLASSDGAHLLKNKINHSGEQGINLDNSQSAQIKGNVIDTTVNNGISLGRSNDAVIANNILTNIGVAGISLWYGNNDAKIFGNNIQAAQNGIELLTAGGQTNDDAVIGKIGNENTINAGTNGISADSAKGLTIKGNDITSVDNGINLLNTKSTKIIDNTITGNGSGNGIYADGVDKLTIGGTSPLTANEIKNVANGIVVDGGKKVSILNNTIDTVGFDGIFVKDLLGKNLIQGNLLDDVGSNAISALDAGNLSIVANQIGQNNGDTIGGAGISVDGATKLKVSKNEIAHTSGDGISVANVQSAVINKNTVNKAGGNGISLNNVDLAKIAGNTIDKNSQYGLFFANVNGTMVLTNNVIHSLMNGTGARFEGGMIDLTGKTNKFTGGVNGLEFDGPTVSLVGDTFGTTKFKKQSGYYIQLSNGALFNPGAPTVLDAREVDFDGFVPGNFILSFTDYQALTARLYDFADDATLGSIFFTYPGADINDILPQQRLASSKARSGGSITILGLPYASFRLANITTPGGRTFNIFGLKTAAGPGSTTVASNNTKLPFDPQQLNQIATSAGGNTPPAAPMNNGNPEALNNIATAAGGSEKTQTVGCWGQVYNHLSTSSSAVTFSLDDAPAAMIGAKAGCK